MEAYVLFPRKERRREVRFDEDEDEDVGCPSEPELFMSASSEEDLADDDDDGCSSGSTTCNFEMSSLMTQLPLKRGLSKFFDGKSQSFGSLAAVGGLEDLPKPPPRKRLRASRSCEDARRGRFSRPRGHNAIATAAAGKKVPGGRLSVLGAAPARRTLPAVAARPEAVPGQALLFV